MTVFICKLQIVMNMVLLKFPWDIGIIYHRSLLIQNNLEFFKSSNAQRNMWAFYGQQSVQRYCQRAYAILLFSHWKLENCFKLGIVIFSGRRKRKNFSYIVDGSCVFFFKHANLTQLCVSPPIQKILTCNRGFRRICRSFNNKTSLGKHSNGTQTIT